MNCTELHELAAAHALGALPPEDAARLRAVTERDPEAQSEVARLNDTAAALVQALVAPITPPPSLRARILERVRNTRAPAPAAPPQIPAGFRVVLNDDTGWIPGAVPGLRIKPLAVSRDLGYRVVMAELAPGGRFPEHDHNSSEELFIVSGHLQTAGRLLGPGDFLHAEPGTHHDELVSPDGCVALLIDRAPAVTTAGR